MKNVMIFGRNSFNRAVEYAEHQKSWWYPHGRKHESYFILLWAPDHRFGITRRGYAERLVKQGWKVI